MVNAWEIKIHVHFLFLKITIVEYFFSTKLAVNSHNPYLDELRFIHVHFLFVYLEITIVEYFYLQNTQLIRIIYILMNYCMTHALFLNELWIRYYFPYSSQKSQPIYQCFDGIIVYEVWSVVYLLYFFHIVFNHFINVSMIFFLWSLKWRSSHLLFHTICNCVSVWPLVGPNGEESNPGHGIWSWRSWGGDQVQVQVSRLSSGRWWNSIPCWSIR